MIKVIDNFLPDLEFQRLKASVLSKDFLWTYQNHRDFLDDNTYQLVHMVFDLDWYDKISLVDDLLRRINPIGILKIKINCTAPEKEVTVDKFHVDYTDQDHFTTGILYINSNDGYTEFEDGTKVESLENRFVKFPVNTLHRGSTSTVDRRVVLNINYLETKLPND